MQANFKNRVSVHGFFQKFMVSLLLHGIVLFGMAGLWPGHPAAMMPVFQSGEFSLELGLAYLPPVPVMAKSAPLPTELPVADVEEDLEEPDSLQLASIMPPLPAAVPDIADNPTAPITAPPISGTATPGIPKAPHMESHIRPIYPPGARLRGEEGTVTVRTTITSSGKAQSAEVLRSSGFPALDQAAVNAVRRARFIPAQQSHVAVKSQTILAFRFTLVD